MDVCVYYVCMCTTYGCVLRMDVYYVYMSRVNKFNKDTRYLACSVNRGATLLIKKGVSPVFVRTIRNVKCLP